MQSWSPHSGQPAVMTDPQCSRPCQQALSVTQPLILDTLDGWVYELTIAAQMEWLGKHTFIISQILWFRAWVQLSWASTHDVTGHGPCATWAAFSSGGTTAEDSTSDLQQVIGGTRFLETLEVSFISLLAVGWRLPSVSWASCGSLPCGPLHWPSQHDG